MSGDEFIVTLIAFGLGPVAWAIRVARLRGVERSHPARRSAIVIALALVACCAMLAVVLKTAASPDVRDAGPYLFMYFVLGLAWMKTCELGFAFAGVSARDDVIERRNDAALPVIVGGLIGAMFCYAGGNIGSGPGWWVVVECGLIASVSLALLWLALDAASGVNDAVVVERDPASGLRLGAFLVAAGLVFGRAVAGDWHSLPQTIVDFVGFGWPAIGLLAIAAGLQRVYRPTVEVPRPGMLLAGVVPALVYVLLAIAYVTYLGLPA